MMYYCITWDVYRLPIRENERPFIIHRCEEIDEVTYNNLLLCSKLQIANFVRNKFGSEPFDDRADIYGPAEREIIDIMLKHNREKNYL